jgi:Zn-dependent oligopeptidase
MNRLSLLVILAAAITVSCQSTTKKDSASQGSASTTEQTAIAKPSASTTEGTVIKYNYRSGEIDKICKSQIKTADARIADIVKIENKDKNFANTIAAFETLMADLSEATSPAVFMYSVSTKKDIRKEAEGCDADQLNA